MNVGMCFRHLILLETGIFFQKILQVCNFLANVKNAIFGPNWIYNPLKAFFTYKWVKFGKESVLKAF